MKVFVTGVNGQLGHDVMLELAGRGHLAIGSGSAGDYKGTDAVSTMPYVSLDVTDAAAVEKTVAKLRPDAVIHCSAWTAVDAAEDAENREKVLALNALAPESFARACDKYCCKLLYPSTDYVFNGEGTEPRQPDDEPAPLNFYGATKLMGENAVRANTDRHFIVRIAWVFGVNGRNFVKTMINVGKTHSAVRVVNDQFGTPTYTKDLAVLLADMIETEKYGTYHATNEGGYISWFDFCREIYRQYGLDTEVIPVSSSEYGLTKAKRPQNSRLDKQKLSDSGFVRLPDWKNALERFLAEAKL